LWGNIDVRKKLKWRAGARTGTSGREQSVFVISTTESVTPHGMGRNSKVDAINRGRKR